VYFLVVSRPPGNEKVVVFREEGAHHLVGGAGGKVVERVGLADTDGNVSSRRGLFLWRCNPPKRQLGGKGNVSHLYVSWVDYTSAVCVSVSVWGAYDRLDYTRVSARVPTVSSGVSGLLASSQGGVGNVGRGVVV
jgi:hypothetical protein